MSKILLTGLRYGIVVLMLPAVFNCEDSTIPSNIPPLEDVVWSLGANQFGELGNGSLTSLTFPYQIEAVSQVVKLEASAGTSMALTANGKLITWGNNELGQVGGNSDLGKVLFPVQVLPDQFIVDMTSSSTVSAAVDISGLLWLWGTKFVGGFGSGGINSKEPILYTGLPKMVKIRCGNNHCLALSESGEVWAWGSNLEGGLGDGTTTSSGVFKKIEGIPEMIDIAVGSLHSLALSKFGEVYAWGSNRNGELGSNFFPSFPSRALVPGPIPSLINVVSIASGDFHNLCLLQDGRVIAWGLGTSGQLGIPGISISDKPEAIKGIANVREIDASGNGSCAITNNGEFYAWGVFDQFIDFSFPSNNIRSIPTRIECLDDATAIARGYRHYLVAKDPSDESTSKCF